MKKLLPIVFMFIYSFTFSQITLSETHQSVSCFGMCNGSATISVSGGTAPYTYSWTTTPAINSSNAQGLCAGLYTVTVMDVVANTSSLVVNIAEPTSLVSAIGSFTNVSCFGQCNGGAYILANGGSSPYAFSWTNGNNVPTATNLCSGFYGVTITDANGCLTTRSVNISQPTQMITSISHTNATCGSTCDGVVSAIAMGGTPSYSYIWLPGALTSSFIQNLCVGIYTLQVTDGSGCSATSSVNILNNGGSASIPNATVTTTLYSETCYLSGDGAIDLSITGTNPGPFTYQWSNGATTQDITNLTSNLYWITIIDGSSNCMTIVDTLNSIGVNCGTISGNIFIDNNSDCIKNTGDNNYNSAGVIINPGNRLGYTNANGDYSINDLPYGTYSVSINNIMPNIYPSCTTTLNPSVNAGSPNSLNNNLSVAFNSVVQPDLQVSAWNGGIVPGFVCRVNYQLNNLNIVNANGLFKVTLPSAFISNITATSPTTYTLSGDTVIWDFNNVDYYYSTSFYIDFTVPLSTPLGSMFTTCMWAQPTVTDLNYTNNTYCYQRTVTGSYDPNDKTPNPIGIGPNGDIAANETDLTYLIRFQNTGNGPAINIKITDTLSPNVNPNTFQMIGASHNYNIDILPGNVLRWKFNDIMLPDSNSNEPASHGYIQYRIKRTNNNTPGTQIKNTAYIYFDFNAPVITNTAINTIETINGIHSQSVNDNGWSVYPNPSNGVLYLVNSSMVKEATQVQILNTIGQTVFEESMNSNYKNIDLSKLNNGVYFVKISSDKQNAVKRIVISK